MAGRAKGLGMGQRVKVWVKGFVFGSEGLGIGQRFGSKVPGQRVLVRGLV